MCTDSNLKRRSEKKCKLTFVVNGTSAESLGQEGDTASGKTTKTTRHIVT